MSRHTAVVAWAYELALTHHFERGYGNWEPRVSAIKPNVPDGSIRNLTPLFAAPMGLSVSEVEDEEIKAAILSGDELAGYAACILLAVHERPHWQYDVGLITIHSHATCLMQDLMAKMETTT